MRCRARVKWETPRTPGTRRRLRLRVKSSTKHSRGQIVTLINFLNCEALFKAVRNQTLGHSYNHFPGRDIQIWPKRQIILRHERCSVDSEGSVRTNTGIIYNALSNNKFRESFSSFEAFYIWPVNYSDKCLDIDLLLCWKKVNTIHFFT